MTPAAADLNWEFFKPRNLGFGVFEKISKCKVESEGLFALQRTDHSRRKLGLATRDKCMTLIGMWGCHHDSLGCLSHDSQGP